MSMHGMAQGLYEDADVVASKAPVLELNGVKYTSYLSAMDTLLLLLHS